MNRPWKQLILMTFSACSAVGRLSEPKLHKQLDRMSRQTELFWWSCLPPRVATVARLPMHSFGKSMAGGQIQAS